MTTEICNKFVLHGYNEVEPAEVDRRINFAKMRSIELSVLKDELSLADKAGELCRIDVALNEFDLFLVDFIRLLKQIPDKVQSVVPATNPNQYAEIRSFIDDALQRLSKKRLHLTIESTASEKAANTAAKEESIKKNAKIKKKQRDV